MYSLLRNIIVSPYTKNDLDFGTYKRMTVERDGEHSPFFYGPMTDEIYLNLVNGAGNDKHGIKIIRRVLDHMYINNHTPSPVLVENIIDQCIAGKWPEALFKTVSYATNKKVSINPSVWGEVTAYFRFCLDYFESGLKIIDMAIKSNVFDWEVIEPYIKKYLKHKMIKESDALFKKFKDSASKHYKKSEENSPKISNLVSKYLSALWNSSLSNHAYRYYLNYFQTENFSEDSIIIGFKYFEEAKRVTDGINFFRKVIEKDGFYYTPLFVAAALRMCVKFGNEGIFIVDILKDAIIVNNSLASPFSLNMIIVCYSYSENWIKLMDFMSRAINSKLNFNKYTLPTLQKLLEGCLEPGIKRKILEYAAILDKA